MLQVSSLHACTCKDKRNKLADKQRNKQKEKHAKDKLGKDAKWGKQTCEAHKEAKKRVFKQKGSVLGGKMQVWIECA